MKPFTLSLFAALVTISIVDVGAPTAEQLEIFQPNLVHNPALLRYSAENQFNSAEIKKALGDYSNDNIRHVFWKILTALQKQEMTRVDDTKNFVKLMGKIIREYQSRYLTSPYLLIFEVILDVYGGTLHDGLNENFENDLRSKFLELASETKRNSETKTMFADVISKEIASSLKELIQYTGNNPQSVALDVVISFLTNKNVIKAVYSLFEESSPHCDEAEPLVAMTIDVNNAARPSKSSGSRLASGS